MNKPAIPAQALLGRNTSSNLDMDLLLNSKGEAITGKELKNIKRVIETHEQDIAAVNALTPIQRQGKTEDGLTLKQEKFARLVSEGSSYISAYRQAYDVSESASDGSLYGQATRLAQTPKVRVRIKALIDELLNKPSHEPEALRALALSVFIEVARDAKAKQSDRLRAGQLLGQVRDVHLFKDSAPKPEQSANDAKTQALHDRIMELIGQPSSQLVDITHVSGSDTEPKQPCEPHEGSSAVTQSDAVSHTQGIPTMPDANPAATMDQSPPTPVPPLPQSGMVAPAHTIPDKQSIQIDDLSPTPTFTNQLGQLLPLSELGRPIKK